MVPPTILFTLFCAQLHWPEFRALYGDESHDSLQYKSNAINIQSTVHIFWIAFFLERTEAFAQHCLHNTLGAEWHWYCYEHAVIRSRVHCYVLHEKCPYSEFFLFRIFPLFRISPYLVRMRENTDQKNSG